MKKPFWITFLVLFVLAFASLALMGISKIENNAAIVKSPAFVLATREGIAMKIHKSGRTSFKVHFTYAVAGTTYKIDSHWMDTEEEAVAFGARPVQVVYATTAPADGIFQSKFDQRNPRVGVGSALVAAAAMGLLVAAIGTLALLGPYLLIRRFSAIRSF